MIACVFAPAPATYPLKAGLLCVYLPLPLSSCLLRLDYYCVVFCVCVFALLLVPCRLAYCCVCLFAPAPATSSLQAGLWWCVCGCVCVCVCPCPCLVFFGGLIIVLSLWCFCAATCTLQVGLSSHVSLPCLACCCVCPCSFPCYLSVAGWLIVTYVRLFLTLLLVPCRLAFCCTCVCSHEPLAGWLVARVCVRLSPVSLPFLSCSPLRARSTCMRVSPFPWLLIPCKLAPATSSFACWLIACSLPFPRATHFFGLAY
jgi:hypothetical protein